MLLTLICRDLCLAVSPGTLVDDTQSNSKWLSPGNRAILVVALAWNETWLWFLENYVNYLKLDKIYQHGNYPVEVWSTLSCPCQCAV